MDADGATEIEDLEKLYDSILKTETKDSVLGGTVGVAVGSRSVKSDCFKCALFHFLSHGTIYAEHIWKKIRWHHGHFTGLC